MIGQRLPPLNALRAFEATARHLSVKNASDDLGVTLFKRLNRGLVLTEAGQSYLPAIRNAFRQIAEATGRLAAVVDSGLLTVSTTPFFASAWLVPRLKSFQDAHPDIDLELITSTRLVDFSRDGVDVAIRHGLGRYSGMHSERVLTVEVVPVAGSGLVAQRGIPEGPSDLLHWPLVHDAER